MKLSHFNFELPDHLLAKYPSEHRDEARLMVLNRENKPSNTNILKILSIILMKMM